VIKQADVVLALYLQSEAFSIEEKRRNFMYYEKITTHDSSLSPCIHSIIAAEIGELEKAYAYFERTARMDLDDVNGNVKDGIHTASMGGTWLALVAGFGGFREVQGKISFRPTIPKEWNGYAFSLAWQERIIHVEVCQKMTTYSMSGGAKLKIIHHDQEIELTCEHPIEIYH
jgi:alpha,alpha-trehalose phosphorylase